MMYRSVKPFERIHLFKLGRISFKDVCFWVDDDFVVHSFHFDLVSHILDDLALDVHLFRVRHPSVNLESKRSRSVINDRVINVRQSGTYICVF